MVEPSFQAKAQGDKIGKAHWACWVDIWVVNRDEMLAFKKGNPVKVFDEGNDLVISVLWEVANPYFLKAFREQTCEVIC